MEQMVSHYFAACRKQDANAIAACFAPGAVHYFPHRPPLLGRGAIGNLVVADLRDRGGEYLVDRVFTNVEQSAAAVEWSRTLHESDRILRGCEIYEFDRASILVREIRGYYAAAPNHDRARNELVGFDYAGRGYKDLS